MKSPRALSALLFAVLLIATPILTFADESVESQPVISEFSGESLPGIMTQVVLNWKYYPDITSPDLFNIEVLRIGNDNDTNLVANLPGSTTEYRTAGDPGVLSMKFILVVSKEGRVVATTETLAPIAHQGVIGVLTGKDAPNDGGNVINLDWTKADKKSSFKEYRIYRNSAGVGSWEYIGTTEGAVTTFSDMSATTGEPFNYMVRGYRNGEIFESKPVMNLVSVSSWFDWGKINLLIIAIIVLFAVAWYVARSGNGKMHYIRKIAGLQAVEEAVGRATEMGKSVLFIPGIQDLDDVQTIAGLTILGSVAKMTAQYETKLDVPVSRSLVMSNGREVVKQAYMSVGRPDFYNDDIVHYVTDEQFGYVAAIDGIMVREKPAACFYMGAFFAESLILAETGNHVGAIQIAGTAMPTQLPFFVAACDYTLIGEELFAASAYLSKDVAAIASLRGQDVGKLLAMVSIIIGVISTTIASLNGGTGIMATLSDAWLRLFALNY